MGKDNGEWILFTYLFIKIILASKHETIKNIKHVHEDVGSHQDKK